MCLHPSAVTQVTSMHYFQHTIVLMFKLPILIVSVSPLVSLISPYCIKRHAPLISDTTFSV